MQSKLFEFDLHNRFSRRAKDRRDPADLETQAKGGALDLRGRDPSAKRDRSVHRRSAWLYEDLLN